MNSLLATLLSGSGTQFEYTYSIAAETGMVEQADVDWNVDMLFLSFTPRSFPSLH